MVEGVREGFYAGFRDGALEAEYVCTGFSFKTSIPLVNRTRGEALCSLAEKIFRWEVPYQNSLEIPVFSSGYESLSKPDRECLSSHVIHFSSSDKE